MVQAISRHFLFPYTLYLKLKCNNLPRGIYFISLYFVIQHIIQRGETRSKYNNNCYL